MDSYVVSNGSWFMVTLDSFQNPPLGSRTKSPWPLHIKHSHWWKRWSWSKFASHYVWGTNGVCECKVDVKSMRIPTWHQMHHVPWSLGLFSKTTSWSKNSLTQNQRNHGILNVHNRWFILFYHVWETRINKSSLKYAFGWGPGHIWLHITIEDPRPHYMILEVSWDGLRTLSFGLSQFHGHSSRLMCEVVLSNITFFNSFQPFHSNHIITLFQWSFSTWFCQCSTQLRE